MLYYIMFLCNEKLVVRLLSVILSFLMLTYYAVFVPNLEKI